MQKLIVLRDGVNLAAKGRGCRAHGRYRRPPELGTRLRIQRHHLGKACPGIDAAEIIGYTAAPVSIVFFGRLNVRSPDKISIVGATRSHFRIGIHGKHQTLGDDRSREDRCIVIRAVPVLADQSSLGTSPIARWCIA